jgi:hypothetical protein
MPPPLSQMPALLKLSPDRLVRDLTDQQESTVLLIKNALSMLESEGSMVSTQLRPGDLMIDRDKKANRYWTRAVKMVGDNRQEHVYRKGIALAATVKGNFLSPSGNALTGEYCLVKSMDSLCATPINGTTSQEAQWCGGMFSPAWVPGVGLNDLAYSMHITADDLLTGESTTPDGSRTGDFLQNLRQALMLAHMRLGFESRQMVADGIEPPTIAEIQGVATESTAATKYLGKLEGKLKKLPFLGKTDRAFCGANLDITTNMGWPMKDQRPNNFDAPMEAVLAGLEHVASLICAEAKVANLSEIDPDILRGLFYNRRMLRDEGNPLFQECTIGLIRVFLQCPFFYELPPVYYNDQRMTYEELLQLRYYDQLLVVFNFMPSTNYVEKSGAASHHYRINPKTQKIIVLGHFKTKVQAGSSVFAALQNGMSEEQQTKALMDMFGSTTVNQSLALPAPLTEEEDDVAMDVAMDELEEMNEFNKRPSSDSEPVRPSKKKRTAIHAE